MIEYAAVKCKQTGLRFRLGVFGGVKHKDVHCVDTCVRNDHVQNAIPRKVHSILYTLRQARILSARKICFYVLCVATQTSN